jgi:hypothetical protein
MLCKSFDHRVYRFWSVRLGWCGDFLLPSYLFVPSLPLITDPRLQRKSYRGGPWGRGNSTLLTSDPKKKRTTTLRPFHYPYRRLASSASLSSATVVSGALVVRSPALARPDPASSTTTLPLGVALPASLWIDFAGVRRILGGHPFRPDDAGPHRRCSYMHCIWR